MLLLCALGFGILHPALCQQAEPNRARVIFEEVDARRTAIEYERSDMQMVIYDSKGRTRNRTLESYAFDKNDISKSLLVFQKPANVRGTGFLTLEEGTDETQKLYLPALKKIQTIAASQKGDRFMGSDFTYEDLGAQNPDDYELELLSESGTEAVIKAIKTNNSAYAYMHFYVDLNRYALTKAEYFDESERMVKKLEAEDFQNVDGNIWRANRMTMFDLKEDRKTELSWSNRTINQAIPEWRFTERGLRRN